VDAPPASREETVQYARAFGKFIAECFISASMYGTPSFVTFDSPTSMTLRFDRRHRFYDIVRAIKFH
jgi:hypothetical protein